MNVLGTGVEFKAGDLVRLNSGGPLMTVLRSAGGYLECGWFDEDHRNYSEAAFTPESLTSVTRA
jgi:uncharacterized protein YodC (DUF2158 family)